MYWCGLERKEGRECGAAVGKVGASFKNETCD